MDFELTESQKMLQTMVREFANKELEPIAAEIDEECRFPAESMKKMAELGLMGLGFPEEYGGCGGGDMEQVITIEEISRVCATTSVIFAVSSSLSGYTLFRYGNEEQKKRFATPVIKGEKYAAFGLTEPGAGSDPAGMETTAKRHKNGYLINGNKIFITNGKEAEFFIVFCSTDKSLKHKGISAIVVEKGTPGFAVGKLEHKLGIRGSSTAELSFQDCFVPAENMLGKEGDGFHIAINTIDSSRMKIAAQAVGIAQGAFEKALAYAKDRQQFGQPIINFQAIQWMLADMATQIDAARLLTYHAVYLKSQGKPFVKEASMAKLFASETASSVANKAIQIHGGYGYTKDYPVERYFRDARITEIYEGTSEMQRMTIARHLMRE